MLSPASKQEVSIGGPACAPDSNTNDKNNWPGAHFASASASSNLVRIAHVGFNRLARLAHLPRYAA